MPRRAWFEESGSMPLSESVERLESWQKAIEDGVIEPHEVSEQIERIMGLLRTLEPLLDDAQHELVTRVLEEWAVLQAMQGTLLVEEFASGRSSLPEPGSP